VADVVVGQVVADLLEVGAEADRAARSPAGLVEAALADGEREPPRRGHVGEHLELLRLAGAVVPGGEAERPAHADGSGREPVQAAAAGDDRGVQVAGRLLRRDLDVRHRGLPDPCTRGGAVAEPDRQRRRMPARKRARNVAPRPRRAAGGERIDHQACREREQRDGGERRPDREHRETDHSDGQRCARSRAHRGTGTAPSAVRTAAPAS